MPDPVSAATRPAARRTSTSCEGMSRPGTRRGSARSGAEQLFRAVRYGYGAFLARLHVPHRADGSLQLVFAEDGRVGGPGTVGLPELALRAAVRVVEVAGDALGPQGVRQLHGLDAGFGGEGDEEDAERGRDLVRGCSQQDALDAGSEADPREIRPSELGDQAVVPSP